MKADAAAQLDAAKKEAEEAAKANSASLSDELEKVKADAAKAAETAQAEIKKLTDEAAAKAKELVDVQALKDEAEKKLAETQTTLTGLYEQFTGALDSLAPTVKNFLPSTLGETMNSLKDLLGIEGE